MPRKPERRQGIFHAKLLVLCSFQFYVIHFLPRPTSQCTGFTSPKSVLARCESRLIKRRHLYHYESLNNRVGKPSKQSQRARSLFALDRDSRADCDSIIA